MCSVRIALAVLATLAGCGDRRQANSLQSLENSRPLPPTVVWREGGFSTTALPAVARNADIVVLALRENDAGRGFPNLRIEVRGRGDKSVRSIEILNSNDYETLAPAGAATAALTARIAATNAQLKQLHAAHELEAMAALELQQPGDDIDLPPHSLSGSAARPGGAGAIDPHVATGDGLRVNWHGDRLEVFATNGGRRVASVDGRGWLAPPQPSCASCAPCENPAFLGAIYHAPGIDVVVAQIRYRGTDACWEPSDQFHVVAW